MKSVKKESLIFFIGALLILTVVAITFLRPAFQRLFKNTEIKKEEPFSEISPEELAQKIKLKEKIVIFDVRSKALYAQEHLANSVSISSETIDNKISELSPSETIIIIGSNYKEAESIARLLREKGFQNTFILSGGMGAWKKDSGGTVSWGNPNSFVDQSKVKFISVEESKKKMDSRKQLTLFLDVRNEAFYSFQRIPSSQNVPLEKLEEKKDSISATKEIIVYGDSEIQAFQAGVKLFDLGFLSVKVLTGGFDEWVKKGYPVEPVKK
jgi:rhodanese-related sulfurtransferase